MPRGLFTMPARFGNTVDKWPRKAALVAGDRVWTYAEVAEASALVAGWLRDRCGVGPGTRVAIATRNRAETIVAYWATVRLGAAALPVNHRLDAGRAEGPSALAHLLREGEPACLVADGAGAAVLGENAAALGVPVLAINASVPGAATWADALAHTPASHSPLGLDLGYDVTSDMPAILLYTSGTTGLPKAAVMSHEALAFNNRMAALAHSLRHEDVHLLAIPFFVPTACYSLVNTAAYLGATLVLSPDAEPATVAPLIERWRCTTFFGVPTMLHFLTTYPGLSARDLRSLRLVAYSGSPMPVRTIRRLRELFPGVLTHNFFGLTETIAMTHVLPSAEADTRPESIGKLLPEIDARVVDAEGRELPPRKAGRHTAGKEGPAAEGAGDEGVGELVFRRDVIIPEYWRRPGLLEESLRHGWFHTGDLAFVDEDGYFYVHGRSKDMVIVAGQNVYCLEVEQVILRMEQVREVAVVGVPATGVRAALGELVKAVVVPHPGETLTERDVKRHCAARLPSYKRPQIVEFAEALPRNAAGKVLKRALAEHGGGD